MIKDDQAHFIPSGGHDLDFRKPPFEHAFKAVKTIVNLQAAQKISITNPKMILDKTWLGIKRAKGG